VVGRILRWAEEKSVTRAGMRGKQGKKRLRIDGCPERAEKVS
jgi:hypothetical protein